LLDADGNFFYASPIMSLFRVAHPKREEIETAPVEALVDTGCELTWLPRDVLDPRSERRPWRDTREPAAIAAHDMAESG
jgi:hypothetical protein